MGSFWTRLIPWFSQKEDDSKRNIAGKAISLGSISREQRLFSVNEPFRQYQQQRQFQFKTFVQDWIGKHGGIRVKEPGCEPVLMSDCFRLTVEYLEPMSQERFLRALKGQFRDARAMFDASLHTHTLILPFHDPDPQLLNVLLAFLILCMILVLFYVLTLINPDTYEAIASLLFWPLLACFRK